MNYSEVWKSFPEASEYEVSTHGRVRKNGGKPKKLPPYTGGYLKTGIRGSGNLFFGESYEFHSEGGGDL